MTIPAPAQLPNGMSAQLGEPRLGDRTYAPHQLDRQVVKETELSLRIDHHQSIGLGHLRRDLRQVLGAGDADRDGKAKLGPDTAPDRACNLSWRTEEMGAARDVGEGLVDGNPLHQRREIVEHVDGRIAQSLVLVEMTVDKDRGGQSSRAPPDMPPLTPKALAS